MHITTAHLRQIATLPTPSLLLDEVAMGANIERMDAAIAAAGIRLRPHVKTCKSEPIVERMLATHTEPRIAVSTLAEARAFAAAGYADILYAVGIVPGKFAELARLQAAGARRLAVILDSLAMADALAAWEGEPLGVFIEIDVDGGRAGIRADDPSLDVLAARVAGAPNLELRGLMTYAGAAYHCKSSAEIESLSRRERHLALAAAQRLRGAGLPCPEISVGSTPTTLAGGDFAGITEARVGVYVFFDVVMQRLGVCDYADVALGVVASVIGHRPGELVIDAGWMALSSERADTDGSGLGVVLALPDAAGDVVEAPGAMIVRGANQEHGIVARVDGEPIHTSRFPIGSRLCVLPIHACATAAQFDRYERLGAPDEPWSRFGGW
ncbi:MAG: alanine racemase [Pseudomonadota bacterium]